MKQLLALIITYTLITCAASGCKPEIGDSCKYASDCPSGSLCDRASPGGYCLAYNCEIDAECPEKSTCVIFDAYTSYCLAKCKSNSDCRTKYTCRDDIGNSKFCYTPKTNDTDYDRNPDNQLPYTPPENENNNGENKPTDENKPQNPEKPTDQNPPEENDPPAEENIPA